LKLGLHIAYRGLGLTAADQWRLVQEAERLDFSSVWVGEAYGSDAATVLGWLAAGTTRIALGSGVFQMPARSPAMTALTRQPLEFAGETLTLPLPDGPGKPIKLTIRPMQDRVPVYLASIGPKNTALAGEIADGWLPVLFSPEHVGEVTGHLAAGAARAGRALSEIAIAPIVYTCVDEDVERAREALRPLIALYIGGMGSREAALPAELLDTLCLCGSAARVRDRLAAYSGAGVDTLLVSPIADTYTERVAGLETVAAAV
jgi:alkanesulfonate monooxygenase SsuD/methylene tetrahydromethanopterin reductase-like flavin-dependent oxidoreductase (luciferase family)